MINADENAAATSEIIANRIQRAGLSSGVPLTDCIAAPVTYQPSR
jgi:hypothetical protein